MRRGSRPVKTCPECIASHRRARGERGDGKPTVCVVCGEAFARTQRNQRRCDACRRAKPGYSPDHHAEYFALHGHR